MVNARISAGLKVKYHAHALLVTMLVSVVLVLASAAFQTKTVYSWEELQEVKFGLPFPFVVQNQNYKPPLPYEASLATVQEHDTTVLLPWLLVDVFVVFCGITLLGTVLLNTIFKFRQEVSLRWFLTLGYGSLALLLAALLLFALIFVYYALTTSI